MSPDDEEAHPEVEEAPEVPEDAGSAEGSTQGPKDHPVADEDPDPEEPDEPVEPEGAADDAPDEPDEPEGPADEAPGEPSRPPAAEGDEGNWWSRRSRGAKIGIVALVVLGVVLVALALSFNQTNAFDHYEQPVSAETRAANSALTLTLARSGIDQSLVDVNEQRAYVAYSLPAWAYGNGSEADPSTAPVNETTALEVQRFVLGATANNAPAVPRFVIVQYDGTTPRVAWDVQAADYGAYFVGDLTLEEFEARIDVTRYDEDGQPVE